MEEQDRQVLIVDDDGDKLEALVRDMNRLQGTTVGVRSGEDAIALVAKNPRDFQFAVIDQALAPGMIDGIETTRRLVDLSADLYVLVYTEVPSDDREVIAKFKYQALAAGAHRYLERGSPDQAPKQIRDFVAEMERLKRLQDWIREYYDTRATVLPSLLTELDIGVDIIDSSFKVWYMNRAMRRITGMTGDDFPRAPCSVWHEYGFAPCLGCLVKRTLDGGGTLERKFLSPLPLRQQGKLFYLHVWTQLVRDDAGRVLLAPDGRPLAVMESVQDLTGSDQLRQMRLGERLQIIAGALRDCPAPGRHHDPRCFDKVRLYLWDRASQTYILKAAEGFSVSPKLDVPVHLDASGNLDVAERHMQESGYGYWFKAEQHSDPLAPGQHFIYWPVMEGGRTVAVLEAMGGRSSGDAVPLLRPYAEEVRAALKETPSDVGAAAASGEARLAEVDLKLQTVGSNLDALRLLVRESCRLTDSKIPILRYRDGDEAVLLGLGLSEYEKVAKPRYPLSHIASWSVRTIVSGQEQLANTSQNRTEIETSRKFLTDAGRSALVDMKALCFEPLILEGRCIGSLGFHAEVDDNYTTEKRDLARSIARRTALALHDYLVEERARNNVREAQDETIQLVLHNINTPLATLRAEIQGMREQAAGGALDGEEVTQRLGRIEALTERIASVRDQYLKLSQPWESRLERVNLYRVLREGATEVLASRSDVSLELSLSQQLKTVQVDSAALLVCLGVLLQNSLDELDPSRVGNRVSIEGRLASSDEAGNLHTTHRLLAVDVSDNGRGVPAEVAKDLFKIAKSDKAKGLGMGLSYGRRVVKSTGGDIYHHTDVKGGAKFTILLPFFEAERARGAK